MDIRMNARRTKCDHKSLPSHYVTGELKRIWKRGLAYSLSGLLHDDIR